MWTVCAEGEKLRREDGVPVREIERLRAPSTRKWPAIPEFQGCETTASVRSLPSGRRSLIEGCEKVRLGASWTMRTATGLGQGSSGDRKEAERGEVRMEQKEKKRPVFPSGN